MPKTVFVKEAKFYPQLCVPSEFSTACLFNGVYFTNKHFSASSLIHKKRHFLSWDFAIFLALTLRYVSTFAAANIEKPLRFDLKRLQLAK